MAFPFSEDHDMIREAARGFLQDVYDGGKGPERIYEAGIGFDAAGWKSFAAELGMAGIAIDEDYGGAGLGDLGRVVIMEELGAALSSIPFSPTCTISADMISAFGTDEAKRDWLPKIATGEVLIAYTDGHDALTINEGKLSGRVNSVLYGVQADLLLMSLRSGDRLKLIGIPKTVDGVSANAIETMDPTRSLSNVELENVALSDVLILGEGALTQFDKVVKTSFITLAAECVGGAQKCLEMTVEYAAQRVQFGRPIASFQAIKHRCADMFIMIEAARSAVYAAATADESNKVEAALIAKAYASDAFFEVAGHAIQLHGGIGFTWEYPLHYFFKRARANRAIFGSSARDYARLADNLLGDAA
ncbi:MAG: acyl-CoA dehydrogenase family protein [Hellea sp.]